MINCIISIGLSNKDNKMQAGEILPSLFFNFYTCIVGEII
jgi:hypothetical protein